MLIKNISLEEIRNRVDVLKSNPTDSEVLFKKRLDEKNINYEFQFPIEAGASYYIVDFLIGKTIIEIDGYYHTKTKEYDKTRDYFLKSKGYSVIRIWNSNVDRFNIESIFKIKKKKPKNKKKQKIKNKFSDELKEIKKKKKQIKKQEKLKRINKLKYPYL